MAKKVVKDQNVQVLKQDLKNGSFHTAYILHGEETFLVQHYCGELRKKILDPATEAFNYHRFNEENFSLDAVSNSLENFPMMAERTLIQVDDVDLFSLNEGDREKLIEILSDLPDYGCLVFCYGSSSYKPDKRLKKLYGAITDHVLTVEFPKQEQRELISWIIRHFRSRKKNIDPNLCAYLIDITDGTMTMLQGEISKIAAYAQGEDIQKSDIDAVTEPVMDAVVFEMTDQLAQGDYSGALLKLQTLFKMQQEPIMILGAIGSQMRKLSAARVISDSGKGADTLMNLYNLRDFAANKTMRTARQFPQSFYKRAMEILVDTDKGMKTSFDDSKRLLEFCLFQLAQEARNGKN